MMRRLFPCLAAALLCAVACETRKAEPPATRATAVTPVGPARVRAAAVAGSWYPGDGPALARLVDGLLDAAPAPPPQDGPVRALVAPHAGYEYSGPAAAAGYRVVRGQAPRRVIVLGPSHHGDFRGASVLDATHYRTPLGDVPVDVAAVAALRAAEPLFSAHPDADAREHSVEMQLPMLQRALAPGWRLVPVVVGRLEAGDAARLAAALRPLADDDTLVVASGDFTHYGERYGYAPFPADGEVAARLRGLDDGFWQLLAARDGAGLVAYRQRTGITVCGYHPFLVLAELLPADARPTLVHYDTSGARTGDFANSVSYVAGAFAGPHPPAAADEVLSAAELQTLHVLAVRAVAMSARSGVDATDRAALGLDVGGRLSRPSGAFVTLKQRGELRGCIGSIAPREPLWRAVLRAAANATLHDGRFIPVTPDEMAELTVEVSVLGPLRPIPGWESFRAGEHGIVMEKGGRSAVFLPEVAREQGWGREETLTHLSRKAGLDADAWREGASFEVFTSQIIEAPFSE